MDVEKELSMQQAKATVDKSLCVACGMCAGACPAVFRMGSDGLAEAFKEIPMEFYDDVQDIAMDCPVGAIRIERIERVSRSST